MAINFDMGGGNDFDMGGGGMIWKESKKKLPLSFLTRQNLPIDFLKSCLKQLKL